MRVLDIRHITVRNGALDLEVAVFRSRLAVGATMATRMLHVLPNLANHVCVNETGMRFGDELVGTELPHLLEHTIIELQGQAYGHGGFTGHTSWIDQDDAHERTDIALMRTTVTFEDDLLALRVCTDARGVIEWAFDATGPTPDIALIVSNLRSMIG